MDQQPRTFTREQLERELAIVEERERVKEKAEDAARARADPGFSAPRPLLSRLLQGPGSACVSQESE
jgi:hypothetical protein